MESEYYEGGDGGVASVCFSGGVIVVEEPAAVEAAVEELSRCGHIGFDTETRPAFRKGESYKVGLLQLATDERVFLFRLNKCGFANRYAVCWGMSGW